MKWEQASPGRFRLNRRDGVKIGTLYRHLDLWYFRPTQIETEMSFAGRLSEDDVKEAVKVWMTARFKEEVQKLELKIENINHTLRELT